MLANAKERRRAPFGPRTAASVSRPGKYKSGAASRRSWENVDRSTNTTPPARRGGRKQSSSRTPQTIKKKMTAVSTLSAAHAASFSSPADMLGAYIAGNPARFNAATPQEAIKSVDRALNYFRRRCIKFKDAPLTQAPFIKLMCKMLAEHNVAFRRLIAQRGGVDKFLAATCGAYVEQHFEPKWIPSTLLVEGDRQFLVRVPLSSL
jgi:hypothetical protein